jgi:hypothetical protein
MAPNKEVLPQSLTARLRERMPAAKRVRGTIRLLHHSELFEDGGGVEVDALGGEPFGGGSLFRSFFGRF